MTATLDKPTTNRDVWSRALHQLPRAAARPDAPKIVEYISAWLAILQHDIQASHRKCWPTDTESHSIA